MKQLFGITLQKFMNASNFRLILLVRSFSGAWGTTSTYVVVQAWMRAFLYRAATFPERKQPLY